MPVPIWIRLNITPSICSSTLPDAAVVFEGAGSFLTFQAELDCTWIVFLLENGVQGLFSIMLKTMFEVDLYAMNRWWGFIRTNRLNEKYFDNH